MKRINGVTGTMIFVMAFWVVFKFFEAAVYSAPIIISIAIWYRGWNKTSEGLKYIAIFLPAAICYFDVYFLLKEDPLNVGIWMNYIAVVFFPVFLLFASYVTRNRKIQKTIPILSYLIESIERGKQVLKEGEKKLEEERE